MSLLLLLLSEGEGVMNIHICMQSMSLLLKYTSMYFFSNASIISLIFEYMWVLSDLHPYQSQVITIIHSVTFLEDMWHFGVYFHHSQFVEIYNLYTTLKVLLMYILTSQSGLGSWDNCDSITNAHGVEMHHKVTCTLYSIVKVVQAQCNVI